MRFADKVVIVTGSARGIGKAIAEGFAKEGASVVVVDIRQEQGEAVAQSISDLGGKGIFVKTDVSSPKGVAAMIEKTLASFAKIDVLVNNAGICPFEDFLNITEELWDRVLAVNLKGYFLCSQAVHRSAHRADSA